MQAGLLAPVLLIAALGRAPLDHPAVHRARPTLARAGSFTGVGYTSVKRAVQVRGQLCNIALSGCHHALHDLCCTGAASAEADRALEGSTACATHAIGQRVVAGLDPAGRILGPLKGWLAGSAPVGGIRGGWVLLLQLSSDVQAASGLQANPAPPRRPPARPPTPHPPSSTPSLTRRRSRRRRHTAAGGWRCSTAGSQNRSRLTPPGSLPQGQRGQGSGRRQGEGRQRPAQGRLPWGRLLSCRPAGC